MKVKLKDKSVKLPNMWKQCGVSHEDWQELHNGKEVEMESIPENINSLLNISGTKKKGDK